MSGRIKSVLSRTHEQVNVLVLRRTSIDSRKLGYGCALWNTRIDINCVFGKLILAVCCCISKPMWEGVDGSLQLQLWSGSISTWSHSSYVNLIVWRLSKHQGHSRGTNGFRERFMRKLLRKAILSQPIQAHTKVLSVWAWSRSRVRLWSGAATPTGGYGSWSRMLLALRLMRLWYLH